MSVATVPAVGPAKEQREELLQILPETVAARFYEPTIHGVDIRRRFSKSHSALVNAPAFSAEVNKVLSGINAYPLEFFHESERRIGLWKSIGVSFYPSGDRWIFQDVLPDYIADRAGVRPGAELIAVAGAVASTSEIPKYPLADTVEVTYRNPGQGSQSFRFDPAAKADSHSIRYVTHKKLGEKIGYIRISKWTGILGMEVARATDDAIKSLSKPNVLIVDIRGNLGSEGAGNLRLMGYFTPDKIPVGYSLTRQRAEQGYRREDLAQFTKVPNNQLLAPLTLLKFKDVDKSIVVVTEGLGDQPFHGRIVLLVNEHTISGAEIVAGFARDHGLATLIGNTTAGKLLGWTTLSLPYEYRLTIPTVNYLTWEGKSFERVGVEPHIRVPFDSEAAQGGRDNQLEAALAHAQTLI